MSFSVILTLLPCMQEILISFRFLNEVQEAFTIEMKMPGLFTTWSRYLVTVGLIFKSLSCRVSEQIFYRKSSCG